jgi:hypothetical protein
MNTVHHEDKKTVLSIHPGFDAPCWYHHHPATREHKQLYFEDGPEQ